MPYGFAIHPTSRPLTLGGAAPSCKLLGRTIYTRHIHHLTPIRKFVHDRRVRALRPPFLLPRLSFLLAAALGLCAPIRTARAAPLPQGQYPYASYGEAYGYGLFPTYAISQDARGVLWFAADNGLHRFDGRAIRPLSLPASLPSSLVTALLPGPSGSMWCLSGAGLLLALDDRFTGPEFPGLLGKVLSMASPSPEGLWVGTDQGLFRLASGLRFEPIPAFSGRPIHSIWVNPQGDFVFGGLGTLSVGTQSGAVRHFGAKEGLAPEAITGVAKDKTGHLWFHSRRRLWVLSPEPFSLEEKTTEFQTPWFLGLSSDTEGRLWLGTTNSIIVVDGGPSSVRREPLPESHGVHAIFEDMEGSVWIGSFGLHRVLGRGQWRVFGEAQGLSALSVWTIVRDRRGTLWVGTAKGLFRDRRETGRFEIAEPLAGSTITTLLVGEGNTLWVGSRGPNVWRYIPDSGELTPNALPGALADTRVVKLIQHDGLLWVVTTAGLYRSEDAGHPGQFIRIAFKNDENKAPLTDIMADTKGRIWVGTEQGPAVIEDPRRDEIHRFSAADGLSANTSTFFAERKDGRICITRGAIKGIRCFLYENNAVRITDDFDRSSGMTSDTLYLIGTDQRDRLWAGSARGLDVIEGKKVVATYDHRNGLPNDDINAWSMLREEDGDLWFGTAGGVAHYHEGPQRPPPLPAPVWTDVRLGGKAVSSSGHAIAEYANNTIEAKLIVPSFLSGDKTSMSVRLTGVLPDWETLGTPTFRYAGLDPGDYVLEARAQRPHEPWGPPATFFFTISKPFYRTWPFRIAFVFFLIGLGALVPLWQRRALRRRNAALEALVEERTRALSEAHARLLELSKWATEEQMAGGFAHEIRNALAGAKLILSSVFDPSAENAETLCAEQAAKLKDLFLSMRGKLPPEDRKHLAQSLKELNAGEEQLDGVIRDVDAALARALSITQQILSYSRLGAEKALNETLKPRALIEQMLHPHRIEWENQCISVTLDIPADAEVRMGTSHFQSIVENILWNARDALLEKPEGERQIRVALHTTETDWTLLIEDTGTGIDPTHLSRLFEPFFSTKPRTGTGLGLGIVRRMCKLYAGDVHVNSELGRGTQVRISVPMPIRGDAEER